MAEKNFLAEQFEANRGRLRAVAYRMLGSTGDAEDAVQEAWLRLARADAGALDNLGGWLTTVVARICLDMLRARRSRHEAPLDADAAEPAVSAEDSVERAKLLGDSVGLALLIVLDKLTPAERVAFVLHDMFDLPFDEIAPIVDRSPAATRQLASRARRRVRGTTDVPDADLAHKRQIVEAFLAASRSGDLEALLTLLDPDVVFRPDKVAAEMGKVGEIRGAAAVADMFKGRAQAAKAALIDGAVGVAVAIGGQTRIVLDVTIANGRIAGIEALADPQRLGQMEVEIFEN